MPIMWRRPEPDLVVHERERHVAAEVLARLQAHAGQVVAPSALRSRLARKPGTQ